MHTESSKPNARASLLRLAAVGLLSAAATLSLHAQAAADQTAAPGATTTAPAKKDDDVVTLSVFTVQGSYADSLAMAAEEKESAPGIIEAIAPEDIGKLPDVSIADSLARLPGLTSQRVNGRDQQITIRGLSSDFSVGTLDGVEQASTNDNRAIEFDQYPSELVGGVQVLKTGEADLVGGLAGTIDLETTSPLSTDHRVIVLQGFYNWTQYKELTAGVKGAGESYSASYIDQFANGTEGIYLGYAHTENPYEGEQFQAWGYPTTSGGDLVLGGAKFYDQSELLKRDSVVGVLESKPNDSVHSKIDLFFSHFNDNELLNGLQVPMSQWSSAQLQPGYTVTNGLITQQTLKNVQPVVDNQLVDTVANLKAVTWNLDLGLKSEWPVKVLAGYSEARRNEEVLETYAGLGFAGGATDADTWQISTPAGPNPPQVVGTVDFTNASLFTITDPQGWGTGTFPATGQEGYLKYFNESDIADSVKISTTHELTLPVLKDVVIGVGDSHRNKFDEQAPTGYLVNSDGKAQDPLPPLVGVTNLGWIGNISAIDWSAQSLLNSGKLKYLQNPNPGTFVGDDYNVQETIIRPFVKFDLKGNLGSIPFEGNIGAVADLTNQSSTGTSAGGGNIVFPVSASETYADVLPSLTLNFHLDDKDTVRLFVGKEEQRPRMYDMRASRDFGYNASYATSTTVSPWSGSAGNPDLHPWIADSADLSFEHYFSHKNGYFALAGFFKKLESYIYKENTLTDFTGYPYTSASAPLIYQGYTSQEQNGQGGNVSGLEGTLELDGSLFTSGFLSGFGVELNGLLVDSNIKPWGPTNPSAPLPDMAKKSANFTLFYEGKGALDGFTARVSVHYQGETREYIVQFGAPTPQNFGTPGDGYSEEVPYHSIEAQLKYEFKSGFAKGFTVYLEGWNLNNAPLINYNNGDSRQLENWQKYGATYRSGISYKF
jgi:iron complex outermembrane receptor protein